MIRQGDKTFHVDGYDVNAHVVYEFHGCFWHRCPKCYPECDKLRHTMTMCDVYEATRHREDALFAMGYSVIVMWECGKKRRKATTPCMLLWTLSGSCLGSNPKTHSSGDVPTLSSSIIGSSTAKKSTTMISRPSTRGPTKTVSTLWGIPRSISNLEALTSVLSLGWSNVRFYHPMVCTILSYPIATVENSRFPSVEPAWNTSSPNC